MILHFTSSLGRHRPFHLANVLFQIFGRVCEAMLFAWWLLVVAMFVLVAAGFCQP